MKALMGNATLTKYTPVNLPGEPLDAVSLLIHAPEVVSSYVRKTREFALGNEGDVRNESAGQLTAMEIEDTPLFVHIWSVAGLGSIFRRGRVCGGGPLSGLVTLFSPFSTLFSAFLGFGTFLSFLPVLLGHNPFPIDTGAFIN